jgi:hypothetical protein
MWKKAVVTKFETLSQELPGEAEENQANRYPTARPSRLTVNFRRRFFLKGSLKNTFFRNAFLEGPLFRMHNFSKYDKL